MRHDGGFEHGLPLFFPYRKIAPHTDDVDDVDDDGSNASSAVVLKGEMGEIRDIS